MIAGDIPIPFGEINQPLLASTHLKGPIVVPVSKGTIQVVGFHEVSQVLTTCEAISVAAVWMLVATKSTHKDSHSVVVVFFPKIGLNLLGS